MEGGDLSNDLPYRMLFLWEDTVARRPQGWDSLVSRVHQGLHRRQSVLDRWAPNPAVTRRMWDLAWRHSYRLDLLTLLGEDYRPALEEWVDRHDLPVSHVHFTDRSGINATLAALVDVHTVFYGDSGYDLWFGGKGRRIDPRHDWEPFA